MKSLVGLCFIWFSTFSYSQLDSTKIYEWELAKHLSPDSVFAISFKKMKLTSLPEDLKKYHQLTKLDVSFNKLTSLPSYLKDFKRLQVLDLSKNKFDSLPAVVYEITSLKKLTFSRNQIERIDEKIGQLTELRYLDFWDNPIGVFPEAFLDLKKLKVIHAEGIRYGPKFQAYWGEIIPNTKIYFDAPCDCKE